MKNILIIFKKDLKNIRKNFITLLIVGGVCFLPSLYAWVNITACWDTYNNTSSIPIAVVNNDNGAIIKGKEMNIGNEVIKNLKNNHALKWQFVNSKNAYLGVVSSEYYAMIEIPKNFTKNLTSVISNSNPKKPYIIYKVNTKSNPVATKITGVAKNEIINNITSNFIKTVNKTAFVSLNDLSKKIALNKDNILKLKRAIIVLNDNMELITTSLDNINASAYNLSELASNLKESTSLVQNNAKDINKNSVKTEDLIKNVQNNFNNSINNTDTILSEIKSQNNRIKNLSSDLNDSLEDKTSSFSNNNINQMIDEINTMNKNISSIKEFMKNKANVLTSTDNKIQDMVNSLNDTNNSLNTLKQNLMQIQTNIKNNNSINKTALNKIHNYIDGVNNNVSSTLDVYKNNVRPNINNLSDGLIASVKNATSLLDSSSSTFSQMGNLLNTASSNTKLVMTISKNLNNKLKQFKGVISTLSNQLKNTNDNDLDKIISILQSKPELMGDFIASPFDIKEKSIYTINNYGSGMAPIYTTLSLWVGALILTSLFRTSVTGLDDLNITLKQEYLGKLLFFTTIAVIQATIVILGNVFLLKIQTSNIFLMFLIAILSSFTFSTIVYTLVSIFGNIGKAFAIILLVIQIAGCGGTYPIQVDPLFFRIFQPFFPFTYAVNGFREAIAGPLISKSILDVVALILFAIIFILIGCFLKTPLHSAIKKFDNRFKESGLSE